MHLNVVTLVKKLKGISMSQSKNFKFGENEKFLIIEKCQRDYDIYILRSVNHEMYLQTIKKSTLSQFDDKRFYVNETESKPWN